MKSINQNMSVGTSLARRGLREQTETLRRRIGLLEGTDKVLVRMYIENGNSFRQIAILTGVGEATIARRIQKIIGRLTDGKYMTCVRHRDKFTRTERELAKGYLLQGLSIRQISEKHKWSYYRARRMVKRIEWLIELLENRRQGSEVGGGRRNPKH